MLNQTIIFINLLLTFLTIYGGIKNINLFYNFLYHFYTFLHKNNPLIIDHTEYETSKNSELIELKNENI